MASQLNRAACSIAPRDRRSRPGPVVEQVADRPWPSAPARGRRSGRRRRRRRPPSADRRHRPRRPACRRPGPRRRPGRSSRCTTARRPGPPRRTSRPARRGRPAARTARRRRGRARSPSAATTLASAGRCRSGRRGPRRPAGCAGPGRSRSSSAAARSNRSGAFSGWIRPTKSSTSASAGRPALGPRPARWSDGLEDVEVDARRHDDDLARVGVVQLDQGLGLVVGVGDQPVGRLDDLGLADLAARRLGAVTAGERVVLDPGHGVHRVHQRHLPALGGQPADLAGEPVVGVHQVVPAERAPGLGAHHAGGEGAELARQVVLAQPLVRAGGHVPHRSRPAPARPPGGRSLLVARVKISTATPRAASRRRRLDDVDVEAARVAGAGLLQRRGVHAEHRHPPRQAARGSQAAHRAILPDGPAVRSAGAAANPVPWATSPGAPRTRTGCGASTAGWSRPAGPLLRAAADPLVVDLGYGASPVTTVELLDPAARGPPGRRGGRAGDRPGAGARGRGYAAARAELRPRRLRARGWRDGRRPVLVRAANVLRQYDEGEVGGRLGHDGRPAGTRRPDRRRDLRRARPPRPAG